MVWFSVNLLLTDLPRLYGWWLTVGLSIVGVILDVGVDDDEHVDSVEEEKKKKV